MARTRRKRKPSKLIYASPRDYEKRPDVGAENARGGAANPGAARAACAGCPGRRSSKRGANRRQDFEIGRGQCRGFESQPSRISRSEDQRLVREGSRRTNSVDFAPVHPEGAWLGGTDFEAELPRKNCFSRRVRAELIWDKKQIQ